MHNNTSLDISQERQCKCTHIATVCSMILGGQLVELPDRADNLKIVTVVDMEECSAGGVNLNIYPGKSENEL